MNASDEVYVRQLKAGGIIAVVLFEFDGKAFEFRHAFTELLSAGLFIKFLDADSKAIACKLSDNLATMSKNELFHAMSYIARTYNLSKDNRKDIQEIVDALNAKDGKETKLDSKDEVYRLIEAADKCRKEVVLCLLGKPGIGKTEAVERFAKDHGRKVVHIIASQILPSEVSGMTMPNQETRSMDVFDHYRLSHMEDGDILFFDELLKGQQQVLNACLTLIQERRLMSGTKLPDVLVIAAANPLATPLQLPLEIRQRFMFVEVEWNRLQWCEYMESLGFKEEKFIDELSRSIERKLGKDDMWNTLTPRTATKLCLWLRDSGNDPSVRGFIIHSFGSDVLRDIDHAVFGNGVKSAEAQTAEKIIEILTPVYVDPDRAGEHKKIDEIMADAKTIADGEETDLTELMSKLMALPEWGEIQTALLESEIEEEKIEF